MDRGKVGFGFGSRTTSRSLSVASPSASESASASSDKLSESECFGKEAFALALLMKPFVCQASPHPFTPPFYLPRHQGNLYDDDIAANHCTRTTTSKHINARRTFLRLRGRPLPAFSPRASRASGAGSGDRGGRSTGDRRSSRDIAGDARGSLQRRVIRVRAL